MMKIAFTKMQGAGNDFLVFDGIHQTIHFTKEEWKKLADRHFGVGADQMLVVEASQRPDVDFRYRIFNADGGEVEHCGNGARAFVTFVHYKKLTQKKRIKVEILKGIIELQLEKDGQVTVVMNEPLLDPMSVSFDTTNITPQLVKEALFWPLDLPNKETPLVSLVSMGNPHAVVLVSDISQAPVLTNGPYIESHPRFLKRVNAGFMQIVDTHHIALRVFERGVGETLSCGSGACAAVVVGILSGYLTSPVSVATNGGKLSVSWAGLNNPVLLSGPAKVVFEGEIDLNNLKEDRKNGSPSSC